MDFSVNNGKVISEVPLPIAGLMSECPVNKVALQNNAVRQAAYALGASHDIESFMTMEFISLPVIPHIKITSLDLIDVNKQKIIALFAD